tara:strand:- start:5788 stop:6300 length:513 start_codon:yes stop_codon:yes gene_type:complete
MIQDTFNQLLNQIVKQELRIKLDVSVEIGANMSVAEIEKEVMTQVSAMFPSNNKRIQSLAYAEECAIYSTEDGEIKWSFLETDCIGRIEVAPHMEKVTPDKLATLAYEAALSETCCEKCPPTHRGYAIPDSFSNGEKSCEIWAGAYKEGVDDRHTHIDEGRRYADLDWQD